MKKNIERRDLVFSILMIILMGCGEHDNNISSVVDKVNNYRVKGVVCADKLYSSTDKLKLVNVAESINRDEYNFDKYDYDTVLTLQSDESIEKLFDNPINCDYLFGEFTQYISYDEPTLYLSGNAPNNQ